MEGVGDSRSTLTRLSSRRFKRLLLYISVRRMDANSASTPHACVFQLPRAVTAVTHHTQTRNASNDVLANSSVARHEVVAGR